MAEEDKEVVEEPVEDTSITVFDEAEPEEAIEAEAEEAKGEDEETTAEVEAEETETISEPPSQKHVPIAALMAMRKDEQSKRKEAETKLEHYGEVPDPLEDAKGFEAYIESKAEAKFADYEVRLMQQKIDVTRSTMLATNPDYPKHEKAFMDAVSKPVLDENGKQVVENGSPMVEIINKALHEQFLISDNPAVFADKTGKTILDYNEKMDPNYEANMRAKWEAEKATMPDLTTATASGTNSEPVEKPAELSNVFDGSPL